MGAVAQKKPPKYIQRPVHGEQWENVQISVSRVVKQIPGGNMNMEYEFNGIDIDASLNEFEIRKETVTTTYDSLIMIDHLKDFKIMTMEMMGMEEKLDDHGLLEGEKIVYKLTDEGKWKIQNLESFNQEQREILDFELSDFANLLNEIALPEKLKRNKKYKVDLGDMFALALPGMGKSDMVINVKYVDIVTRNEVDYIVLDAWFKVKMDITDPYGMVAMNAVIDMEGEMLVSLGEVCVTELDLTGDLKMDISMNSGYETMDMHIELDAIFKQTTTTTEAPEYDPSYTMSISEGKSE
jgi:hypothetical protein